MAPCKKRRRKKKTAKNETKNDPLLRVGSGLLDGFQPNTLINYFFYSNRDLERGVEAQLDELAEARRVVVHQRLRVTEGLEQRVELHNLLLQAHAPGLACASTRRL